MTSRKSYVPELSMLKDHVICRIARTKLEELERVASLRLISKLTRTSRTTLGRWSEGGEMDMKGAAWFILCCETDFRLIDLATRPPPRGRNGLRKTTLRKVED